MKVITAPEPLSQSTEPTVFLAGGITDCQWWQDDIIAMLANYEGIIYNPRRRDFPMDDPNAAEEQIAWEFNALNEASIFSIWFCSGPSDQPICQYELGRHLERFTTQKKQYGRVIIGVEPGYKRAQDVEIQTRLVSPLIADKISSTLEEHAANIAKALESIQHPGKGL